MSIDFRQNEIQRSSKKLPGNGDLEPEIVSIIYGSLLGDGHAERRGNGNTRICFKQCGRNAEYLRHLHTKFAGAGICNPSMPIIRSAITQLGTVQETIRFNTYTYSSFNSIWEQFYTIDRKRIVPINIESFLTPLALAIWIMDDGYWATSGLVLSTHIFRLEDTTRLAKALDNLYGLKTTVRAACPNQYIIYIRAQSMPQLRVLVRPHMVSSMLYKLGEK